MFCLPMETSCPFTEKVPETPAHKESSLTCYVVRKVGVIVAAWHKPYKRVIQGGLWHGSRTEKKRDHR